MDGKTLPIYFCGSIRGGTQDAEIYKEIIEYLGNAYGRVLTEHVGDPKKIMQQSYSDSEIWIQDMNWLRESKVVVAECTVRSHGVGYELGIAESMKLPTLCLYRLGNTESESEKKLSAMITGNPHLSTVYYKTMHEAKTAIDAFMKNHGFDCYSSYSGNIGATNEN